VKLLIYRGDTLERTLELSARDFRIGRAAENDVVLEDPEKTVSRFHAELRYENGAYALIDLNSQNGTWIEGERVRRTALGPGQAAVMGNFRIAIEDSAVGAGSVPSVQPDTLSGEMPQTLAMSRDAADALVAEGSVGAAAAGLPAASAPVTPVATPAAAPGPVPAPAAKRASSPQAAGGAKTGVASIPRPIFYGGAMVFMMLIVGVMYVMRPHGGPPPDQAQEGVGIESNAQIIARHVKDGRTKLDAGDTAGAIDAASRALLVDPNSADALDLKVKAEERKRHDLAKAGSTPGAVPSDAPAAPGAATPGTTPATPTASTTTPPAGAPGAPATGTTATPTGTTASTGPATPAKPGATPPGPTRAQQRRDAAKKDQDIAKRYQTAKAAMTRGDYADAVSGFDSVVKERPGYLDAASMLDQARGHIRTQAQQTTQQAAELAAKGEYAAALQQYERARRLDPSLAGAEQGIASVHRQMKEAGDDAFKRARQLDAVGRAQAALPLYEKAVSLLSADDANGKAARERLDALKARTP
jgi:tetratricopeptide (TPR) repeat protein